MIWCLCALCRKSTTGSSSLIRLRLSRSATLIRLRLRTSCSSSLLAACLTACLAHRLKLRHVISACGTLGSLGGVSFDCTRTDTCDLTVGNSCFIGGGVYIFNAL